MGYQQGLSGLSASSSDLDVIGNNIANANTVGFKSGAGPVRRHVREFGGDGRRQPDRHRHEASRKCSSSFRKARSRARTRRSNVAINGNGFFQLSNNGSLVYSRNGVFQLDKNGFITNAQGLQLMGYAANQHGHHQHCARPCR